MAAGWGRLGSSWLSCRGRLSAVTTEAGARHQGRAAVRTGSGLGVSQIIRGLDPDGLWDRLPAFAAETGARA